jgi:hypothetical protein
MKYKMIYGSDNDDFIWEMRPTYSLIERLHLRLAKWHLRSVLKISEKDMDELYDSVYEALMRESIEENPYDPFSFTKINAEDLFNNLVDIDPNIITGDKNKLYKNHTITNSVISNSVVKMN